MICLPFSLLRLTGAVSIALALAQPAHAQPTPSTSPTAASVETTLFDGGQRRELARGLYEVAYSPVTKLLYVASAEMIANVKGGVIYKLDPVTLQTVGAIHTDKKNFALALSPAGDKMYVTNSLEHGMTELDLKTNEVVQRLKFTDKASDGTGYGPRQVIYQADGDLLYVGGVGAPGVIWVIDAKTFELKDTIQDAGKWVTGLLVDPQSKRLYVANGSGEVLVINTGTRKIEARWTTGDAQPGLLLNLALDAKTNRLFVTDDSKLKTVLVFDTRSGKVTQRLPVGDAMGIKLNPVRNELYLTQRQQGKILVLDLDSLKVLKTYDLPVHPNSMSLDDTGQVLYATIKTPFVKDATTGAYVAGGNGSVARIDLSKIGK